MLAMKAGRVAAAQQEVETFVLQVNPEEIKASNHGSKKLTRSLEQAEDGSFLDWEGWPILRLDI